MASKPSRGQDLRAYFQEQALDIGLEGLEGGDAFGEYLGRLPRGGEHYNQSAGRRLNGFVYIRYSYPLHPRYDVVVFDLESILGPDIQRGIYAVALWPDGAEEPEYVCLGGTYESRDGEYRKAFTAFEDLTAAYGAALEGEAEAPEEYQLLERMEGKLTEMIDEDEIVLRLTVYSASKARQSKITTRCDELRLLPRLFIAQTLLVGAQLWAPHIHPQYARAMQSPRDKLSEILKLTHAPEGDVPVERQAQWSRLRRLQAILLCGTPNAKSTNCCGMKILPLMRAEATQFGNVRFPTWREIWIARQASNLTVNGRTTSLPVFNQWAVINQSDELLYDNDSMQRHYRTSEAAVAALGNLSLARDVARDGREAGHPFPLDQLDYYLHQAAEQAERIALSDIALLAVTQHVGVTFGTLPHLPLKHLEGSLQGQQAESLVFDLVYGCLALHDVCIHTDLHYNNVTARFDWIPRPSLPPSSTVFVAGPDGERDTYVVPNHGVRGCIIDFSQGLIAPSQRDALERHQGVEQTECFYREQAVRMLLALNRWLPDFTRAHEREIKGIALARQQELYNVMTAIDYLALGENLGQLFRKLGKMPTAWKVDAKVIKTCAGLKAAAHAELLKGLRGLLNQKAPVSPAGPSAVGRQIMREVFSEYLFTRWDPARLEDLVPTEAYNVCAPLRYDGEDPERFPPWAQPENLLRFGGGRKLGEIIREEGRPLLAALQAREDGDDELEIAVSLERGRLADAPRRDGSKSWLA